MIVIPHTAAKHCGWVQRPCQKPQRRAHGRAHEEGDDSLEREIGLGADNHDTKTLTINNYVMMTIDN